MRAAVLPILVIVLTVLAGPPEPALLISVAEVSPPTACSDGDRAATGRRRRQLAELAADRLRGAVQRTPPRPSGP